MNNEQFTKRLDKILEKHFLFEKARQDIINE